MALTDKGKRFNRELMDYLELGYMLDLAEVIAMGALRREESRGAHWREDFPQRDDDRFLNHTVAVRAPTGEPHQYARPVTITRFQPKERTY